MALKFKDSALLRSAQSARLEARGGRRAIPRPPRPRNDRRFGKIRCRPGNPLLLQFCRPAAKPIHQNSAAKPPPGSLGARLGSFRNPANFPPFPAKSRPPRPHPFSGPPEGLRPAPFETPRYAGLLREAAFVMALKFKDSALLRSAQSARLACPEPPPPRTHQARRAIPRLPRRRKDRRFGKIRCRPGSLLLLQFCWPAATPIQENSAAKPPSGSLGARLGSFRNPPNFPPNPGNPRPIRDRPGLTPFPGRLRGSAPPPSRRPATQGSSLRRCSGQAGRRLLSWP